MPLCKQLRFKQKSGSSLQLCRALSDSGLESQMQVSIYLHAVQRVGCSWHACQTRLLTHVLQSLLDDSLVSPMVHKGYGAPGYSSSTEWGRLKSKVNVGEGRRLPVDWGQPFEYKKHSVGIITSKAGRLLVLTGIHWDAPAIKKLNKSLMWMNTSAATAACSMAPASRTPSDSWGT